MKKKIFIVLAMLVLVSAAIFAAIVIQGKASAKAISKPSILPTHEGRPRALAKHLDEMLKTIPGNGGESEEGPGGPADEKLYALAYPDTEISLQEITAAQSAFQTIKKRGFPKGKGQPGVWVSIGPANADVPFFKYRDTTVYVPQDTYAAGRTTAFAISPSCSPAFCRLWVAAAGGGIWRTDKALAGNPVWTFLSSPFSINSSDTILQDPNDPSGNTLWVGTGEGGACGDCAFGVGIYKTTDGGNTWTGPLGNSVFNGRAVASIAVPAGSPDVVYAAIVRAVNGVSSVSGGGVSITVPGAALWGLYKSTDGGTNWTYVHNGATTVCNVTPATLAGNGTPCSPRGTRRVLVDPVDTNVVYASSFGRGVWRSPDAGATWEQIKAPPTTSSSMRTEMAIAVLGSGDTRMYTNEGDSGSPTAAFSRSDSVRSGVPSFTQLSSSNPADPGYGSYNTCTGQCWYDQFIYSPPGYPDIVYLSGSYSYNENDPFHTEGWISNGRGVVLSQDGGVSFTDQSYDSTDFLHPNGLHPDHHALITNPSNPFQFFDGSDGGVVRSSGNLVDISSQCDTRAQYGLSGDKLTRCKQLLSAVPSNLQSISKGLTTLQFQSVGANPHNVHDLQGGTQDNGTWESYGNPTKWLNTMIGDGGQSGFDIGDQKFRFHTFFRSLIDANFNNGDVADWNWIADPLLEEFGLDSFYVPVIHDPAVSSTLYLGSAHVWRTKTNGRGSMSVADLTLHCNEWTGDFTVTCGDWVKLGDPGTNGRLTSSFYGTRSGGFVTSTERTASDTSTLWAATSAGRVFISKNADAEPETSAVFTRLDTLDALSPGRFVSAIFVDPANANHAWITYSGFNIATPTTPGHIFSVTYDSVAGTATWVSLDGSGTGSLGDLPLNDVAFDHVTGDLYIANDFGVLREAASTGINWTLAASGMPAVETPGITIVPEDRKLYAATHGLSAWQLNLP